MNKVGTAPARRFAPFLAGLKSLKPDSAVWTVAGLAIVLVLQFHLLLTRSINWDEFWYYAQIEQHARGSLTLPLQTIHVQLFGWLRSLPGNGVDHIIAGRIGMFAAEMATLAAIWGIASHFTDRRTGLLAVLAYLTSIYTFRHGASFRVDPLAASLSMTALLVLLKLRLNALAIAGFALCLGLAGMVTVKTVLFAPAFAGIAWLRLAEAERWRETLLRMAACAIGAGAVFGIAYWLHANALTPSAAQAGTATGAASNMVKGATDYVFAIGRPAYLQFLTAYAVTSPLQTLTILLAPIVVLRSRLSRDRKIALGAMWATGLVFLFYRNTLPYFYAFILPPIICAAAPSIEAAARRYSTAFIAAALTVAAIALWVREPDSPINKQRMLVSAAEEIFPQPVAYFDFCAMLARFDKANPFMTAWGITAYRQTGVPVMRQEMMRRVVPLVLASEQESFLTFDEMLNSTGPSPYFVDEDVAALRGNYVHFWGPYWLAGKAMPAGTERHEEFLVPGPYTVHGAAVLVDGKRYKAGEIVRIERGFHDLNTPGRKPARLIWGENLKPPAFSAPKRPYWTDF